MLIVGAKGFAKEVVEVCRANDQLVNLLFYDDVNQGVADTLVLGEFNVLTTLDQAKNYFETVDRNFTIGIGNPQLREMLYHKFIAIGGVYTSTISPRASIGSYQVQLGTGVNILDGARISNAVTIGKGVMIYYNSVITHDCEIGDFVEISPNATILGAVKIGRGTHVGAAATILPNVKIGKQVKIGAGAVVTKDVADFTTVIGVPAKAKNN